MSLYIFSSLFYISDMVRTRGGSRVRPRVRFSTPEREAAAPVPAPVPEPEIIVPAPVSEPEVVAPVPAPEPSPVPGAVPDEPLGFRRYQTRVGPRAPSPVPQRRVGGPGLPSGLALRAQASHHHLDRHHHHQQQQLRRHIHLSCHRPRGSGGPCM